MSQNRYAYARDNPEGYSDPRRLSVGLRRYSSFLDKKPSSTAFEPTYVDSPTEGPPRALGHWVASWSGNPLTTR